MSAGWRALSEHPDITLKVFASHASKQYSFRDSDLMDGLDWTPFNPAALEDHPAFVAELESFRPDVIIFSGWFQKIYKDIPLLNIASNPKCLMAIDTHWTGSIRQRLAPLALRPLLKRLDGIIVPGKKGQEFVKYLGLKPEKIFSGLLPFDSHTFKRTVPYTGQINKQFVYVGRYSEVKGLQTLISAYKNYRDHVQDPWSLTCCGSGPLQSVLSNVEGVSDRGFTQPSDLPQILENSSCFILPSHFEPWGVVIAEACGMGLPIIATSSVGAASDLISQEKNGWIVTSNSVSELTHAMIRAHNCDTLEDFSKESLRRSEAFKSATWPERLKGQFDDRWYS